MEKYVIAGDIKTETSIEQLAGKDKYCIKNELLHDEEITWRNDLNSVELVLINGSACIKTETEIYDEQLNYDPMKQEIEYTVESSIVDPIDCDKTDNEAQCFIKHECDYDINEEFEIKNEPDCIIISDNSSLSCSDTKDSMLAGQGMKNGSNTLVTEDMNTLRGDIPKTAQNESFPKRSELTMTNIPTSTIGGSKCSSCNFCTSNRENLQRHINDFHSSLKKYQCPFCDYSTAINGNVKKHMERLHTGITQNDDFKCNQCDFSTKFKKNLKYHIEAKHIAKDVKKFKCNSCDYSATRKEYVRRHMNCVHLNLKKCPQCEFRATGRENLKIHIECVHNVEKKYHCEYCDFSTNWKYHFNNHLSEKHQRKAIECEFCDYSTDRTSKFESHMQAVHLNLKTYKCPQCDYSSMKQNRLQIHIDSIHLGKKQYECSFCDFTTAWKDSLQGHTQSKHMEKLAKEEKKAIKCDLCDFTTMKKSNLENHFKGVHLKQKKFKCMNCDFSTAWKSCLFIHLKNKHENQQEKVQT